MSVILNKKSKEIKHLFFFRAIALNFGAKNVNIKSKENNMSNRMERANSQIQKCLIEIIKNKMNDPRVNKIVSITEVSVTPDFKFCKAKVSVLDIENASEVVKVLQKSEGFIKRELAQMLDMPQVPKINFVVDKSTLSAIRVEEILRSLNIPKEESEENDDDE